MLGQTVGSYLITGKISEGGMGAVYRAQHALIGKSAAIKVLLPELSANQEMVNRFFNEAKAATAIRHPGIVEIFDFGYMPSGTAFIVMEFLDGEPLSRRLATRGRLEEHEALALLRGMSSALAAAHAKGIVHRDLKPDNVFLVPDPDMPTGERPKLLDFGIAKLADSHHGPQSARTRTGAVMGTPMYMSPEQCRGAGEVDHRSDLYSMGCILYEMLVGRPPFVAEGAGEIIGAHLFFAPEPPRRHVATISAATEALIMRLLAKRPEERIQTAAELAKLLGQGSPQPQPSSSQQHGHQHVGPHATPTTLGGAAAQTQRVRPRGARRSRAPMWAAMVGALAVGGVVVGAVSSTGTGTGKGSDAPASAPASPRAVEPAAAASPPSITPAPALVVDAGVERVVVALDAAAEMPAVVPDAGAAVEVVAPVDSGKRRDRARARKQIKVPAGPVIETDL